MEIKKVASEKSCMQPSANVDQQINATEQKSGVIGEMSIHIDQKVDIIDSKATPKELDTLSQADTQTDSSCDKEELATRGVCSLTRQENEAIPQENEAIPQGNEAIPCEKKLTKREKMMSATAIKRTKVIASIGIFTALTCVMTILVRIPMPGGVGGYINFGDVFIFMTAMCLGPIAGLFAGGVGSAIADLIGFPLYAPFTLVIKGLEGFVCGLIGLIVTKKKMNKPMQIVIGTVGMIVGAFIMFFGYFATECILTHSLAGGIASMVGNAIQGGVSVVIASLAIYLGQLRRISEKFGFIKPSLNN